MQIKNIGEDIFNSYIIKDEKVAVIEGVAEKVSDKYFENLKAETDRVDYLIINHVTAYSASTAQRMIEEYPDIKIIATIAGLRNLKAIVSGNFNEIAAKDEMTLSLGENEIKFLITPNLNWPDTMMTCLGDALFSGIMFIGEREYFEDNFSAFRPFVLSAIERLSHVNAIYPQMYEMRNSDIIKKYCMWAREKIEKDVLIVYDTCYGNTKKMAMVIAETLAENGIRYKITEIGKNFDINSGRALIVGTPTINQNASERILKVLSNVNVVKLAGTPSFVFGAYGWGGEGVQVVHSFLKSMKLKMYKKPFSVNFKMTDSDIEALKKYTYEFIESNLK